MTSNNKSKTHYLNKRGQEEIMGFIIILVLIVLIGLFFMFMLKPKVQQQQSQQVENLLSSIKHVNSACDKEMQEVIIMCYGSELCGDRDACNYLKEELKNITDTALDKAGMGNVIGYSLNITGIDINLKEGNFTGTSLAAISPVRDEINMELRLYYP